MSKRFTIIQFTRRKISSIARIIILSMILNTLTTLKLHALTGGPSQPEVQSFEPVGTSDMVDISTGDFNYNIPVLDIGGYPLNLSYHAGIEMDQEASWVGLGWNLSPGVLNRNMRGIPDDFKGDKIMKQFNTKNNWTLSAGAGPTVEVMGIPGLQVGMNLGLKYNSFRGMGFEFGVNPAYQAQTPFGKLNAGLDMSYDSESGMSLSPGASIKGGGSTERDESGVEMGLNVGASFNSRTGMQAINYGFSATTGGQNFGMGISPSTSYNFGTQSYIPQISCERRNDGVTMNFSAGSEFLGLNANWRVKAGFSIDKVTNKYRGGILKESYGYYYEQEKGDNLDVILDFNREKDAAYADNINNLPLTNHTFDVYSASGQGIGGSFRTFRSDIPMLHDDYSRNSGWSVALGGEIGSGNLVKWGANIGYSSNRNVTKLWDWNDNSLNGSGNGLAKKMNFSKVNSSSNPLFEPAYIKSSGDMSFTSNFDNIRLNAKTVAPIITGTNSTGPSLYVKEGQKPTYYSPFKDRSYINGYVKDNTRATRDNRNSVFSFLTAEEATYGGLETKLRDYDPLSNEQTGPLTYENFNRKQHPAHHFSEITITQPGGIRYIYGIPAYNTQQVEKTFNVSGRSNSCQTGQVTYSPSENDNNIGNQRGVDHYFQGTSMAQGYAYSYLLTGYLSPDYVDLKNDGITDDDLGTAVKFNYKQTNNAFKWRVPYAENSANFQEGRRSNGNDDMGSYLYGSKEIWYLHTIETKTQIAVFITSDREDGLGVVDENGGKDMDARVQKLDKIILYSKQDFLQHRFNAIPVKTVHFEYDYSLCPSVENNSNSAVTGNTNHGKLTLKKIYFTYGTSFKGRTTSYEFKYDNINPSYNLKGSDWWGNYKRNSASSCGAGDSLSNADFPYTDQNKTTADQNASAWCLSEIDLPSGGKINIEYESDDYAYVQNKRAMQMFKIAGFGNSSNEINNGNFLWRKNGALRPEHYDLIFIDLPETLTGSDKLAKFKRKYLGDITNLQFTVFADMDGQNSNFEYVKGYAEIDPSGAGVSSDGTKAWIKLKQVKIGDKAHPNNYVNPIAKACWNYARLNCDYLIYPYNTKTTGTSPDSDGGVKGIRKAVAKVGQVGADFIPLLRGFYKSLEDRRFAQKVKLNKSWIRLNSPNFAKLGGGHRVKKIFVNDLWSEIGSANTGASDAEYGTEYIYTTTQKLADNTDELISSGVSSYEPTIGGDENPYKVPRAININYALIPDNEYFIEEPLGESFFPSPVVIYSKVKTRAISNSNVKRTGTGYTISEFYTAKDFPVIVSETQIQKIKEQPHPIESLFSFKKYTAVAAAQGYKIELNDMHGKPKCRFDYDEYDVQIGGVKYEYQFEEKDGINRLTNNVKAVKKDGTIEIAELGVEIDMVNDARESNGEIQNFGMNLNVETFTVFIVPIAIPIVYPTVSKQINDFHSIVTTKVVKRFGLLAKTIAIKGNSSIETKNILYDKETGEVLLSATQNEFNDSSFNFTYPAHWAYDGMGQAYKNIGFTISNVTISHDNIVLPNGLTASDFFVPGDECLLSVSGDKKTIYSKAYVYKGQGGNLNFIDEAGNEVKPGSKFTVKVTRSGRRNMASTPIGAVESLTNPALSASLNFNQIVDAQAMLFKDQWQSHLEYLPRTICDTNRLGSDIIKFLLCYGDSIKQYYKFDLQGDYESDDIDSFKYVGSGGTIKLKNLPFNDTDLISPFIIGSDHFCDSFFYYSKLDSQWHSFNIFDAGDLTEHKIFGFFHLYEKQFNICTNNCSNWYFNSSFKTELDTLCEDTACPNYANIKANDTGFSFKFIPSACDLLHPPCPINIVMPKQYFKAITEVVSYSFNEDGTEMYLNCAILDYCGNLDTAALSVTRCGQSMRKCESFCFTTSEQYVINPYKSGLEGNWRPYKTYKYLENRTYNAPAVDTRKDGIYQSFVPFWSYSGGTGKFVPSSNSKWVWASEITKYSPFGNELETKDALNRYQSELFGYYHTLPVAAANNAKYNEIAYDGFEDYLYKDAAYSTPCETGHFGYHAAINEDIMVDSSISHSGWFSLKIAAGATAATTKPVVLPHTWNTSIDTTVSRKTYFKDDLGMFKPSAGKYVFSGWVKENRSSGQTNYGAASVTIEFTDISNVVTSVTLNTSGKIIEGWQRIYGTFTVPSNTKLISVVLNGASDVNTWFDDIRLHPNDANMKSFAYDYRTLRTMASMDENNYATFYEYDAEGSLLRVKKETINGIITLQENRTHIRKK